MPASHAVQAALPVIALYVPMAQDVHDPGVPVMPTPHPLGIHVLEFDAPTASDVVPNGHMVQVYWLVSL